MKFLQISAALLLLSALPSQAAIHILVEPDGSGKTILTLTQSAPNPLLNVSGVSGYALGMELPTSMFHLGDLGPGSDIYGNLPQSLATITELYSAQTYQLSQIVIGSNTGVTMLQFSSIYFIPSHASSLQFSASGNGPISTQISFEAMNPGVHTVQDLLFGTVTVTVVPEPSTLLMLGSAAFPLLLRRRHS